MVPTGTGFRDHYRTRVKKNIDFGEIGGVAGFTTAARDLDMEEMLAGAVDPMASVLGAYEEPERSVLAATGSGGPPPLRSRPSSIAMFLPEIDDDEGEGRGRGGR